MNITMNNTPESLQETFHLMLMTLEYGGSVNMKRLEELEQKMRESQAKFAPALNN